MTDEHSPEMVTLWTRCGCSQKIPEIPGTNSIMVPFSASDGRSYVRAFKQVKSRVFVEVATLELG